MADKAVSIDDLAKKFGGFADHFKKAAAHHDALSKAHGEIAAFHKGKADSMDDGHELKAYMGKMAGHHEAKAALHKAHSEHNAAMAEECAKAFKASAAAPAVVPPPVKIEKCAHEKAMTDACEDCKREATPAAAAVAAGDAINAMIERTMEAVLSKSLETIGSSGKIEEMVETIVLQKVNERLGGKMVPMEVRGVLTDVPGLTPVPRNGGAPITKAVTVEPELADMVEE